MFASFQSDPLWLGNHCGRLNEATQDTVRLHSLCVRSNLCAFVCMYVSARFSYLKKVVFLPQFICWNQSEFSHQPPNPTWQSRFIWRRKGYFYNSARVYESRNVCRHSLDIIMVLQCLETQGSHHETHLFFCSGNIAQTITNVPCCWCGPREPAGHVLPRFLLPSPKMKTASYSLRSHHPRGRKLNAEVVPLY